MLIFTLAMLADAAIATPAAVAPATPPKPKMICRTYEETGSLVKRQKVCRSAAAWGKVDDDMQAEAYRINPHITTEHGS